MPDDAELHAILGVLKHPQRRAMADLIFRSKSATFAQVVSVLQLPQDVASKRLERLRRVGLIACAKRDRAMVCEAGPGLKILNAWFEHLLDGLPDEKETCSSLDHMFQLLSDGGRRRLLEQVSRHPASTVGALADASQLRPDAASRKLRALAEAGCVRMERRGREIVCSLNPPAFVKAWDWAYYAAGG